MFNYRSLYTLISILLFFTSLRAQQVQFDRYDQEFFELDRLIKTKNFDCIHFCVSNIFNLNSIDSFFSKISISELSKDEIRLLETCYAKTDSPIIRENILRNYKENENSKLVFNLPSERKNKLFYKNKAVLFNVRNKDVKINFNPILNLNFGRQIDNEAIIFQNSRGLDVTGEIENKIQFRSLIIENQQGFLNFENERILQTESILGQGSQKPYQSSLNKKITGYDFFYVKSYVKFNILKPVSFEFGHGNFFIGNGIRSLLLSNISHNYLYLTIDTKYKKFYLKNIYAELTALKENYNYPGSRINYKYYSAHILSYILNKRLEISLFEATMYGNESTIKSKLFNPIILYNAINYGLNNKNNVMVGLSLGYKIKNDIFTYGQLMLDDYDLEKSNHKSPFNKMGYQFGLNYYNIFKIKKLDLQYEHNVVRPYSYSSTNELDVNNENTSSFTHLRQPLTHILGANFKENILIFSYNLNRINFKLRSIYTLIGKDDLGNNFGSNILESRKEKKLNNNYITQGNLNTIKSIGLEISFLVTTNMYFDISGILRSQEENNIIINQSFYNICFRSNFNKVNFDY
jgi:hypothetical protein